MVFFFEESSAEDTPRGRGPFKQRRAQHQVRAFHVLFAPGGFIQIEVRGNAVFFRPGAAADAGVVGVGDGRHDAVTILLIPFFRQDASTGIRLAAM